MKFLSFFSNIFFLLCFVVILEPISVCFGQNRRADSLQKVLVGGGLSRQDTAYVHTLIDLAGVSAYTDPNESIKYGKQVLDWSENRLLSPQKLAQTNQILGYAYMLKGNDAKAMEHLYVALKDINKTTDEPLKLTIYNTIGYIYNNQKMYDEAQKYYQKALILAIKRGDRLERGRILNNLGIVAKEQNKIPEALVLFEQSLAIRKSMLDRLGMVSCLNNLGEIYTLRGDFDRSTLCHAQALELSIETQNDRQTNNSLAGMGSNFLAEKNYKQAEKYLLKALENAEKGRQIQQILKPNKELALLYQSTRQFEKAAYFYQKSLAMQDSVLHDDLKPILENMKFEYELEQKQTAIKGLEETDKLNQETINNQQKIVFTLVVCVLIAFMGLIYYYQMKKQETRTKNDLKKQADALKAVNGLQNQLFSILSHDFRSPLVGLQGALGIIYDKIPQDVASMLQKTIGKQLEHLILSLENVLEWTKIQMRQGSNPIKALENIHIKTILEENINLLGSMAEQKQIKIVNRVADNARAFANPWQTATIFRNLLTNSIKFTPKGGQITLSTRQHIEGIDTTGIQITDTGVGMTPTQLKNLFDAQTHAATYGTNKEKGTGFGLLLCKELINQNNGSITVESKPNEGTTFFVELPTQQLN